MQVHDFDNYRQYLKKVFSATGPSRGKRVQLAEFLNCQPSFLTQVLTEKSHLSLEHGISLCEYLSFNESESQHFMLLLQRDKAGTDKLREYFESKLYKIRAKRSLIENRIKVKTDLSAEDQMKYYSSWYFSAIHILCSLPRINTVEDLSQYLKLEVAIIKEALTFLEKKGFIKVIEGKLSIGSRRIHLKNGSAMLPRHHANWRMKAIAALDNEKKDQLHYTAVLGISKNDMILFREKMLKLLEEFEPVIQSSQEEVQVVLLLDLFQTS
jgi:uncharacterized protein (TIGR02147 family)